MRNSSKIQIMHGILGGLLMGACFLGVYSAINYVVTEVVAEVETVGLKNIVHNIWEGTGDKDELQDNN